MIDFYFANHGSITVLTPLTEAAQVWVFEHLPDDARMLGNGIVIEPRYAGPILEGLTEDGLTVSQ
jgi:hypothetical protein